MSRRDDIVKFVGDALTPGRSRPEIEAALREAGWGADDIQHGMSAWAEGPFVPPVPRPFRRMQLLAKSASYTFRFRSSVDSTGRACKTVTLDVAHEPRG